MRLLVPLLLLLAHAASAQTCVEARVGAEVAYGCVNDALARLAQTAHTPLGMNTLGATAPAPAVGTFNRTATAERMGDTFGHSVFSQRPAPPVYAAPLIPGAR